MTVPPGKAPKTMALGTVSEGAGDSAATHEEASEGGRREGGGGEGWWGGGKS